MYYTVEDGKENCLDKKYSKDEAIQSCKEHGDAKEVFEFNDNDELIGCVYKK